MKGIIGTPPTYLGSKRGRRAGKSDKFKKKIERFKRFQVS